MSKENNLGKIYIVKDEDSKIAKYVVLKKDGKVLAFAERPNTYNKLTLKEQEDLEKHYTRSLVYYIKTINEEEIDDIVTFVYPSDEDYDITLEFIDKKIEVAKKRNEIHKQEYFLKCEKSHKVSGCVFYAGILFFDVTYLTPFYILLGSLENLNAIITNKERRRLKKEPLLLKKIRLYTSYILLALTVCTGYSKINEDPLKCRKIKNFYESGMIGVKQSITNFNYDNPFTKGDIISEGDAINYLIEALEKNPMFTEKEKQVIPYFKQYLLDTPNLDYKSLYKTFITLGIVYDDKIDKNIVGTNNRAFNVISLFDENEFEGQYDYYINTLLHECIHSTGFLYNKLLCEGMTSLLASEYGVEPYRDGYEREIIMCKILCELIGPDKMLEANVKSDEKIILDELFKIYPDKIYNRKFLNLLDSYSRQDDEERHKISNEKAIEILSYLDFYLELDTVPIETANYIYEVYYIPFSYNTHDAEPIRYFNTTSDNYRDRSKIKKIIYSIDKENIEPKVRTKKEL